MCTLANRELYTVYHVSTEQHISISNLVFIGYFSTAIHIKHIRMRGLSQGLSIK